MQYYYSSEIKGKTHKLNDEESNHCLKVLRHKKGDIIYITNGKGKLYEGKIIDDSSKICQVEIIDIQDKKEINFYYLHIGIAPTKNIDRFEFFLEKCTEIGINEITPLICENSERDKINNGRLNKILISAMKQSLKTTLPKLNKLTKFIDYVNNPSQFDKYIAHCQEGIKKPLKNLYKKSNDVIILIGPEGDFSKNEISEALKNNFKPVTLSNNRLRTETAGIIACHTINFINSY